MTYTFTQAPKGQISSDLLQAAGPTYGYVNIALIQGDQTEQISYSSKTLMFVLS